MKHAYQIIIIIIFLLLSACSRESNIPNGGHVVSIERRAFTNPLFYSGSIQPLKTLVVPSPAEGVVIEMPFQYGEAVKAGQLLFMLSSSKFLADYKTALMQYVKAKNDFDLGARKKGKELIWVTASAFRSNQ